MCSIVGLEGKFKGEDIIKMLKSSKNRGPDSSGLFLSSSSHLLKKNIDLERFHDDNEYNLGLAHNSLSIFKDKNNSQPIANDKLVLVFNGEIYNYDSIKNFLKIETPITDSYLILNLIDYFYKNDLLKAIQDSINLIDGDYSFAVFDGDNLAITRDKIGVKPLFYSKNENLNGFSSSKKSLIDLGFNEIKTLKPAHILYNWEDIPPKEYLWNIRQDVNLNDLEKLLKEAILKRVNYLDEVGVIFSGGIDSSLIAMLLKEIPSLKITLYAVGSEKSKDIIFAKKAAKILDLPLKTKIVTSEVVKDNLTEVLIAIGENNLMKIGVGMTMYLACKMIKEDGLKVAISGQGADELFGGYNRYLDSYEKGILEEELRYDIANMYHVNLERDDAVSMANGVELRLPYLDEKLIKFALNIPVDEKITNGLRKNILRNLAIDLGLSPEIAMRPKKAAQYGTGIDKILRKKVLKNFDVDSFLDNI